MATDVEQQVNTEVNIKSKPPSVKDSIQSLKKRFAPGLNYALLIAAAFNLSMLVIGCLNVHKCNADKNIPLFLIATGAVGLMSKFTTYVRGRFSKHIQLSYLESALYGAESVFFFLGTYWVYKEYKPSYDPDDGENYCNKTAYLFAFIYLTIYYILILLPAAFLILACCCVACGVPCCLCCLAAQSDDGEAKVETKPVETEAEKALTITKNETESEAQV